MNAATSTRPATTPPPRPGDRPFRYGSDNITRRPCAVAAQVHAALVKRAYTGVLKPCSATCGILLRRLTQAGPGEACIGVSQRKRALRLLVALAGAAEHDLVPGPDRRPATLGVLLGGRPAGAPTGPRTARALSVGAVAGLGSGSGARLCCDGWLGLCRSRSRSRWGFGCRRRRRRRRRRSRLRLGGQARREWGPRRVTAPCPAWSLPRLPPGPTGAGASTCLDVLPLSWQAGCCAAVECCAAVDDAATALGLADAADAARCRQRPLERVAGGMPPVRLARLAVAWWPRFAVRRRVARPRRGGSRRNRRRPGLRHCSGRRRRGHRGGRRRRSRRPASTAARPRSQQRSRARPARARPGRGRPARARPAATVAQHLPTQWPTPQPQRTPSSRAQPARRGTRALAPRTRPGVAGQPGPAPGHRRLARRRRSVHRRRHGRDFVRLRRPVRTGLLRSRVVPARGRRGHGFTEIRVVVVRRRAAAPAWPQASGPAPCAPASPPARNPK